MRLPWGMDDSVARRKAPIFSAKELDFSDPNEESDTAPLLSFEEFKKQERLVSSPKEKSKNLFSLKSLLGKFVNKIGKLLGISKSPQRQPVPSTAEAHTLKNQDKEVLLPLNEPDLPINTAASVVVPTVREEDLTAEVAAPTSQPPITAAKTVVAAPPVLIDATTVIGGNSSEAVVPESVIEANKNEEGGVRAVSSIPSFSTTQENTPPPRANPVITTTKTKFFPKTCPKTFRHSCRYFCSTGYGRY